MHGSGDDELHREMGTNADVLEETAMARRHCALKIHGGESNKVCLVQEQPKISSKAISEDGCGVTTMETIPLETLSSTSRLKWITKYKKMRKLFFLPLYDYMYCCYMYYVFLITPSWKKETKYAASTRGTEFEERNQGGKNAEWHDEGKQQFFSTSISLNRSTVYS